MNTWQVSSHDAACMVNMAKAVGFHLLASPAHGGWARPVASGH